MSELKMPIDWLEAQMLNVQEEAKKTITHFLCSHETCYGEIKIYVSSAGIYSVRVDNFMYDGLVTKSAEEAKEYYCKFVDDANAFAEKNGGKANE